VSAEAVTADIVSAEAVTADIVSAEAVTADIVSAEAVTADVVSAEAVTADIVSAEAVTADVVSADIVSAEAVTADVVTEAVTAKQNKLQIIVDTDQKLLEAKNMKAKKAEALYDCFTRFSREHALIYFEPEAYGTIDIRYKPFDYVCRNDPVHLAACSHLRAYRIMRKVEPSSTTEFEHMSYSDVIITFAQEVVRADDEAEDM
jgi:hypothetical protein